MQFLIFLLSSLCLYISLNCIFITMSSNRTNIKPFCPKFSSPQLLPDFWMKLENLFRCNTFYCLNDSSWAQHWNTLYQKMNVVVICTNLNKKNFKTLRDFNTYLFQTFINLFVKNDSPVLSWTYKMVKKYGNIMTLMNKFAHITNLKLFSKQSFGELTPLRLEGAYSNCALNSFLIAPLITFHISPGLYPRLILFYPFGIWSRSTTLR